MIIWSLKTIAITTIVVWGLTFPASLIFDYAKPWDEAVAIIREEHPSNIWIQTGGSYNGRIENGGMKAIRRESSYLILPENKTVHFIQVGRKEIEKTTKDGGFASFIILMIIIYALFFWQVPKVPGRIKSFLERKSGYL